MPEFAYPARVRLSVPHDWRILPVASWDADAVIGTLKT